MKLLAVTMLIMFAVLMNSIGSMDELEKIRAREELPRPLLIVDFLLRIVFIYDCMALARRSEVKDVVKRPKIAVPLKPVQTPQPMKAFKDYRCRNCKSGLLPGFTVCPQCGEPVEDEPLGCTPTNTPQI
ncbi:hypothetical protein ACFLRC_04635 [Candidatus Altiarchaeota archaeon]